MVSRYIMSADHLSSSKDYEVQRTNNFMVVINIDDANHLNLAVESFPLPTIGNEIIELYYGNTNVKVAGKRTKENGDVVIKDFIGADTEALIEKWRREIYNPITNENGWTVDYRKDGMLYEFSPDGSIARKWKLSGCNPRSVSYGELSNDGSDKKQITIGMSFSATRIL